MHRISSILLKGLLIVLVIILILVNITPSVESTCWVYPNNCSCIAGASNDLWEQGSPNWLYNTSSLYYNETYLNLTIEGKASPGIWTNTSDGNATFVGSANISHLFLGNAEGNSIIYFYEDGNEFGEAIYWEDASDRFVFSDEMYTTSNVYAIGNIDSEATITSKIYCIDGGTCITDFEDLNQTWTLSDQVTNTTSDVVFNTVDVKDIFNVSGYATVFSSPDDYSLFVSPTGSGKRNSPYFGIRADGGGGLTEMLLHTVANADNQYYLEVTDSSGNPRLTIEDDGQVNVSRQLIVGPENLGKIMVVDGRSNSDSPVYIFSSSSGNTVTTSGANVFNAGGVNSFRASGSNTFQNSLAGGLYNYLGFGYWNHTEYFGWYALRIYPNWQIFQWNLNQNMLGADIGSFIINGSEINITSHSLLIVDGNASAQACNTNNEGGIIYDDASNKHYGCDGTNWNALY